MNIPVQGSAAEVLLCSLRRLPAALHGLDVHLAHTIHDEILLDCSESDKDAAATVLSKAMQEGFMDVFPEGSSLLSGLGRSEARKQLGGRSLRQIHSSNAKHRRASCRYRPRADEMIPRRDLHHPQSCPAARWVNRSAYHRAVATGLNRFHLDGSMSGPITPEQRD